MNGTRKLKNLINKAVFVLKNITTYEPIKFQKNFYDFAGK